MLKSRKATRVNGVGVVVLDRCLSPISAEGEEGRSKEEGTCFFFLFLSHILQPYTYTHSQLINTYITTYRC